jgi:hypothetical protein
LLRRMSLSRSRVCPGVCTKAHEGVFQGAPRGGAHTSPPRQFLSLTPRGNCWKTPSLKTAGNGAHLCLIACDVNPIFTTKFSRPPTLQSLQSKGCEGFKDGLQPESLADGNWLVKQKQPVSKIETKYNTNLKSLYDVYRVSHQSTCDC